MKQLRMEEKFEGVKEFTWTFATPSSFMSLIGETTDTRVAKHFYSTPEETLNKRVVQWKL